MVEMSNKYLSIFFFSQAPGLRLYLQSVQDRNWVLECWGMYFSFLFWKCLHPGWCSYWFNEIYSNYSCFCIVWFSSKV